MSNTLSIRQSRSDGFVRNALFVVGASAIIAIAAQIAIPVPFTPVPLTMQPLAVLLVGVFLGARRGAAAAALYLFEGACGAPVFSQGHGGIIWLAGPTAGYLLSYPFAAFTAGWLAERRWPVAGMIAAMAIIYAGGFSWLATMTSARSAFAAGVAPFLIADAVKLAIGAAVVWSASRLRRFHA
jgi:biotin transport system substrate-specific component